MQHGPKELCRTPQVHDQEKRGKGYSRHTEGNGYFRGDNISHEITQNPNDDSAGACTSEKKIGRDLPAPYALRNYFHMPYPFLAAISAGSVATTERPAGR